MPKIAEYTEQLNVLVTEEQMRRIKALENPEGGRRRSRGDVVREIVDDGLPAVERRAATAARARAREARLAGQA